VSGVCGVWCSLRWQVAGGVHERVAAGQRPEQACDDWGGMGLKSGVHRSVEMGRCAWDAAY
jgi:hypothetical protein